MLSTLPYLFIATTFARPWQPTDPCPEDIKVYVSYDPCTQYGWKCPDTPELRTMDALHTALSNCPNITSLDLRIAGPDCTGWPSPRYFPFTPEGGETYPRLKKLRLQRYFFDGEKPVSSHVPEQIRSRTWGYGFSRWGGDVWAWLSNEHWLKWAKQITSSKQQQRKSNFALWMDAMDASGIEELGIDEMSEEVIEKFPALLTSLRTLESTNLPFIQALPKNTLTNLTWIGESRPQDLSTILAHHGSSLQHLEFRCPELSCPSFTPDYDISILFKNTKVLKSLAIDVSRNGTWPLEYLETIVSIPTLERAEVYLNIQSLCRQQRSDIDAYKYMKEYRETYGDDYCTGEDQFQKPYLDAGSALQLFEHMKKHKEGADLSEVIFWVGDWSGPWDGPLYVPPWAEGRRGKVVCRTEVGEAPGNPCVLLTGEKYWEKKYAPVDDDDDWE